MDRIQIKPKSNSGNQLIISVCNNSNEAVCFKISRIEIKNNDGIPIKIIKNDCRIYTTLEKEGQKANISAFLELDEDISPGMKLYCEIQSFSLNGEVYNKGIHETTFSFHLSLANEWVDDSVEK